MGFGGINITDEQLAAAGITDAPPAETPAAPAAPAEAPAETPAPAPAPTDPAQPATPSATPEPERAPMPDTNAELAEQMAALRGDIEALGQAVKPPTPKGATAAEQTAALKAELTEMLESDDERDKMFAKMGLAQIERLESLEATVEQRVDAAITRQRQMEADADLINNEYEQAYQTFGITPGEQAKVDAWVEKNVAIAAVLQPHETIARALGRPFLTPVAAIEAGDTPGNGASPNGAPPGSPKANAVIVTEPGRGGNPGRSTPVPDYSRTSIDKVVAAEAARFGL